MSHFESYTEESLLIDKILDINPLNETDISRIWGLLSKILSPKNLENFQVIINILNCKHRVILAEMLEESLEWRYSSTMESEFVKEYKRKLGFSI